MEPIERIDPFVHQRDLMYPEHLGRYMFASQFVHGKDVIDCSCGNGYGSHYLALHGARSVTGFDIDENAITFSKSHYSASNLEYQVGDGLNLANVPDGAGDVYVCFETIEHVLDTRRFLEEARRVLTSNGLLLVSCPNDNIFNPNNPFHVETYTVEKFLNTVGEVFPNVKLLLQNNTTGTSIMEPEQVENADEHTSEITLTSFPITARSRSNSDTWIAVCSTGPIPSDIIATSTFFTTYSDYIKEIQNTINSLYEENTRLATAWTEHTNTISVQRAELEKLSNAWTEHTNTIISQKAELERLQRAWEEHSKQLSQQEESMANLIAENNRLAEAWETHVKYIHGLEARIQEIDKNN